MTRMIRLPPPLVPKNFAPPRPSPNPPMPKPSPKSFPNAGVSEKVGISGITTDEAFVAVIVLSALLEGVAGFSNVTFLAKDRF